VDVRRAYCSAVDRNVPVMLKPGAAQAGRLTLQDPANLICLDYRVRCTGWCCPLFSVDEEAYATAGGVAAGPESRSGQSAGVRSRWSPQT
jgi:hypothetical protein